MSTSDSRGSYAAYFRTGHYDARYPSPNPAVLNAISAALDTSGAELLIDIGAGSGRYLLPLLQGRPSLRAIAIERDSSAREKLASRLAATRGDVVISPTLPDDVTVPATGVVITSIFGLLAHMESAELATTLTWVRRMTGHRGTFLASVPTRRRFVREQLKYPATACRPGSTRIDYRRVLPSNQVITLPYTLHTPASFRALLESNGFAIRDLRAESVLPETHISRHGMARRLDQALRPLVPRALAYGLLAVSE